jgi:hypothetical protein
LRLPAWWHISEGEDHSTELYWPALGCSP